MVDLKDYAYYRFDPANLYDATFSLRYFPSFRRSAAFQVFWFTGTVTPSDSVGFCTPNTLPSVFSGGILQDAQFAIPEMAFVQAKMNKQLRDRLEHIRARPLGGGGLLDFDRLKGPGVPELPMI